MQNAHCLIATGAYAKLPDNDVAFAKLPENDVSVESTLQLTYYVSTCGKENSSSLDKQQIIQLALEC